MITAGIDIGSLTAKAVVLKDGEIAGYSVMTAGSDITAAAARVLSQALENAGCRQDDVSSIVSTGYGRAKVQAVKTVTEITCDARGAHYLFPEAGMVIDIGGQDSKVIGLDSAGRVVDFAMNDKCAAGTGRFLEVMAHALEIDLDQLGPVSLKHKKPVVISSMCTVFAESEVVSLIAEGCAREDILNGLHQAIAARVVGMAQGLKLQKTVMLGGGVAKNVGVVKALEDRLKARVKVPQEPQILAALGAALCAQEIAGKS
ncbi:MAG TPA: acyl-CoA dehydratase activase [Dehalococcoidales bacterium]|nr:acyl-CoA dehydratase activase [Dehalococcoidales bacterium]